MAAIVGMGTALPDGRLTNADLEKTLDTTDAWIVERTGIKERRIAGPGEDAVTLATAACAEAIKDSGLDHRRDRPVGRGHDHSPTPAARRVGATCRTTSACVAGRSTSWPPVPASSTRYVMADAYVNAGNARSALIVGAETISSIVDPTDRGTKILFGDGAAAAVIVPSAPGYGILGSDLGCDGSAADILAIEPRRAIRPHGRQGSLPSRRARLHRLGGDSAGARGRQRERDRPVRAAPGERSHHRRDHRAHWFGQCSYRAQPRYVRQHVGRVDSAGAGRRRNPTTATSSCCAASAPA